jgi:hypothetical protein
MWYRSYIRGFLYYRMCQVFSFIFRNFFLFMKKINKKFNCEQMSSLLNGAACFLPFQTKYLDFFARSRQAFFCRFH